LLTGYDDLLRRKKSAFRKISVSLITLGLVFVFVAIILWLPINENTTDGLKPVTQAYSNTSLSNSKDSPNWSVPKQFNPVYSDIDTSSLDIMQGQTVGSISSSSTIIIPIINLSAKIEPLVLNNDKDEPYYASPKNSAGHLPTSANPGEEGSVWLFGHLESPFTREGSVFWDIPKLEEALRNNENVNAILENDSQRFVYRLKSISIIDEDQFETHESSRATLHIVTCYPRLKYDKRMVVNGELVVVDSLFD
tara:strand:+ start:4439 stop:5191 length:753 start_codon:yes stop_codon:yes gene_type:complete